MYIVVDSASNTCYEEPDKNSVESRVLDLIKEEGIPRDFIKIFEVKNELDFDLVFSQPNKGL